MYPAPLRDLLVRIASTGIVRARWSEAILDECFRSILEQRPDLKPEALGRTRDLMKRAIPDCMVAGVEALVEGLSLPDPDDRHVLGAAIRAGAQLRPREPSEALDQRPLDPCQAERSTSDSAQSTERDSGTARSGFLTRGARAPSCLLSTPTPRRGRCRTWSSGLRQ